MIAIYFYFFFKTIIDFKNHCFFHNVIHTTPDAFFLIVFLISVFEPFWAHFYKNWGSLLIYFNFDINLHFRTSVWIIFYYEYANVKTKSTDPLVIWFITQE